MNTLSMLTNNGDQSVRTQITLTLALKKMIEEKAKKDNKSLSEYLRQAAVLSLVLEKKREDDLNQLAKRVIGSVDLSSNPNWRSRKKMDKWLKDLRGEWERG